MESCLTGVETSSGEVVEQETCEPDDVDAGRELSAADTGVRMEAADEVSGNTGKSP